MPTDDQKSSVDPISELEVENLSQELLSIGRKKFQEKYSLTFLVSVSQDALVALDLDSYQTVESRSNPNLEKDDPTGAKQLCHAVAKSDRNTYSENITIGRAQVNDIVLRYQSISRVHAALIKGDGDDWSIVDMGSKNGTKLNAKQLAKEEQVKINNGDVVSFAKLSFRFMTWGDFHKLLMELC